MEDGKMKIYYDKSWGWIVESINTHGDWYMVGIYSTEAQAVAAAHEGMDHEKHDS